MTTPARARRPPRIPEWLTEVARSSGGPVPWTQMGHAAAAIAVPMAVGLATGHVVPGVVAGAGGLLGILADRAVLKPDLGSVFARVLQSGAGIRHQPARHKLDVE